MSTLLSLFLHVFKKSFTHTKLLSLCPHWQILNFCLGILFSSFKREYIKKIIIQFLYNIFKYTIVNKDILMYSIYTFHLRL